MWTQSSRGRGGGSNQTRFQSRQSNQVWKHLSFMNRSHFYLPNFTERKVDKEKTLVFWFLCIFLLFQQLEASLNWSLGPSEVGVSVSCPNQREDRSFKNHRNHPFLLSAILCQLQRNTFRLSLVGVFFFWCFYK